MSSFIMAHQHIRLSSAIHQHMRLSSAIHQHIRLSSAIHQHMRLSSAIHRVKRRYNIKAVERSGYDQGYKANIKTGKNHITL